MSTPSRRPSACGKRQISYHPQSGWFEDTPLKGGTKEGCPMKGVHEGTCLLRLDSVRGTTLALLASHRGIVCRLSVARRIALGAFVGCGKRDSPTRHPLLPLNAGTAEPFRVSPPEAVAYPLELNSYIPYKRKHHILGMASAPMPRSTARAPPPTPSPRCAGTRRRRPAASGN